MSDATTDPPMTRGVRALRAAKVTFSVHLYPYVEHGGTSHAASCLQVPEHQVIKTLVFMAHDGRGRGQPLIVLMHGDREVSTKQLARHLQVKSVSPASVPDVERLTSYQPGGVSPFGVRTPLPIYAERSVLDLDRLYINGGKRGFLVGLQTADLRRVLDPDPVDVAT